MNAFRHRLLSLALIALLIQATLPYLLTNCPVYTGVGATISAAHASMPADCPMAQMHQVVAPSGKAGQHPARQSSDLTCPLCAVMSPLHAFVIAGLIALPPPQPGTKSVFVSTAAHSLCQPQTASFSARAPPVLG